MRKSIIYLILFLLFLIEGTVIQYFSPDYYGYHIVIVPRFALAFIIFLSFYQDQKFAMTLGMIFGFLYDLVYGYVFGVYMVGMLGTAYLSGWFTQFLHPTFAVYTFIQFISLIAFEIFVFGMKSLYQLAFVPFEWASINILIPSLVINLIFAILIYYPSHYLINEEE